MAVRWLSPLFSLPVELQQLCVERNAEDKLTEMATELVGSDDVVAIYVPLNAEAAYRPGAQRGRVAGLVRLLPMPSGRTIRHYTQVDLATGALRWPFGWPAEVVRAPQPEQCPTLRNILIAAYQRDRLAEYSHFLSAPHKLERPVRLQIEAAFAALR